MAFFLGVAPDAKSGDYPLAVRSLQVGTTEREFKMHVARAGRQAGGPSATQAPQAISSAPLGIAISTMSMCRIAQS